MQQIASPQRKICKFDFLKIHLSKFNYVNPYFQILLASPTKSSILFPFFRQTDGKGRSYRS